MDRMIDREGDELPGEKVFFENFEVNWAPFRPQPREFQGQIADDTIDRDTRRVESIKEKISREQDLSRQHESRLGKRLEYCFAEGFQSYDWLGDEVFVTPASEHDDIENGIDLILAVETENGEVMLMGVDVVSTKEPQVVDDKILRNVDGLNKGSLSQIRYFKSEDFPSLKPSQQMPRVVLGLETGSGMALYEKFVKAATGEIPKNSLAQGEMINQIREEVVTQLGYYLELTCRKFHEFISRKAKLSPEDNKALAELGKLAGVVKNINKCSDQINTAPFRDLTNFLDQQEEKLKKIDSHLAGNIFKHLELYQYFSQLKKGLTDDSAAPDKNHPAKQDPVKDALVIADKGRLEARSYAQT